MVNDIRGWCAFAPIVSCIICRQHKKLLLLGFVVMSALFWYNNGNVNYLTACPSTFYKNQYMLSHRASNIDCEKIMDGDEIEIGKVSMFGRCRLESQLASTCRDLKTIFTVNTRSTNFSIAYSIILYESAEQAQRLLRAIYHNDNVYCFHIDSKAHFTLHKWAALVSSCFSNVFVATPSIAVYWGHFSVLQAELLCMKTLLRNKRWFYYINLTGRDFPIRTQIEIAEILKLYSGANDLSGSPTSKQKHFSDRIWYPGLKFWRLYASKQPPPFVSDYHLFLQYHVNNCRTWLSTKVQHILQYLVILSIMPCILPMRTVFWNGCAIFMHRMNIFS